MQLKRYFAIVSTIILSSCLSALPKRVIIFRHGEKELKCGNLSDQGVQRSIALTRYFLSNPPILLNRTPRAFFACEPRTIQTISPIAESFPQVGRILFQPVIVYYALPYDPVRFKELTLEASQEILENPRYNDSVLLVCWEHYNIPILARALGVPQVPDWPNDSYDMFWVITYTGCGVEFFMQPQRLLPGDVSIIQLPLASVGKNMMMSSIGTSMPQGKMLVPSY